MGIISLFPVLFCRSSNEHILTHISNAFTNSVVDYLCSTLNSFWTGIEMGSSFIILYVEIVFPELITDRLSFLQWIFYYPYKKCGCSHMSRYACNPFHPIDVCVYFYFLTLSYNLELDLWYLQQLWLGWFGWSQIFCTYICVLEFLFLLL